MKETCIYFGSRSVTVVQRAGSELQFSGRVESFDITLENLVAFWSALSQEVSVSSKVCIILGEHLGYWHVLGQSTDSSDLSSTAVRSDLPLAPDDRHSISFENEGRMAEFVLSRQLWQTFSQWMSSSGIEIHKIFLASQILAKQCSSSDTVLVICNTRDDSFLSIVSNGQTLFTESHISKYTDQDGKILVEYIDKKFSTTLQSRWLMSEKAWNELPPDLEYQDTSLFELALTMPPEPSETFSYWDKGGTKRQSSVSKEILTRWLVRILGISLILGLLGVLSWYYLLSDQGGQRSTGESSQEVSESVDVESDTQDSQLTPPSSESADLQVEPETATLPTDTKISVLNASGIGGLAGEVSEILVAEGFSEISIGNGESTESATLIYVRSESLLETVDEVFTRIFNSEFSELQVVYLPERFLELTGDTEIDVIMLLNADRVRE